MAVLWKHFINSNIIYFFSGFLKDQYEIYNKYISLQHLRAIIEKCQFPGRNVLKSGVKQAIRHRQTEEWRTRTHADPDFRIFQILRSNITHFLLKDIGHLCDGRNHSSNNYLDARVRFLVPGDYFVLYENSSPARRYCRSVSANVSWN